MTRKHDKDVINKKIIKMPEQNIIDRFMGDVSKKSATQQIVLGAGSGWFAGYVSMKVGKVAALAVGGGIILLQVANQQGYISVDWNKITRNVDKVTDKVEEAITKEKPGIMDKAERFVDRTINDAENVVKKKKKQAKRWYAAFTGADDGIRINDLHIFMLSFAAGLALGVGTA